MKTGTASKLECGQFAELASAIIRQLPHIEGLGDSAQGWIENGAALKKALREALVQPMQAAKDVFRVLVNYDLRGGRYVPCLWRGDSGRSLLLSWFGGVWGAGYRFAGVRK